MAITGLWWRLLGCSPSQRISSGQSWGAVPGIVAGAAPEPLIGSVVCLSAHRVPTVSAVRCRPVGYARGPWSHTRSVLGLFALQAPGGTAGACEQVVAELLLRDEVTGVAHLVEEPAGGAAGPAEDVGAVVADLVTGGVKPA